MKKLIAILMVLAIVAGFAFAANPPAKEDANGTAVINVTTTIDKQFPAYKLTATGITTAAGNVDAGESAVATAPTAGTVSINTDEMLTKNATVSFAIVQTKLSRAVVTYKIGVTATDLVMKKDAEGANYTGSTTDGGHAFTLAEGSANPAITTGGIAHVTVSGTNAGTTSYGVTAVYDGVKVAENQTIGTFSCTWQKNEDAAPGTYQALVTVETAKTTYTSSCTDTTGIAEGHNG